ncbi:hypothetical protein K488DRAFT_81909 [Vararia minispora EC-137]|uniref:Uncharacterized protein n=1 Tax=Vararia minispora EC-137 TaxID=1314806 RepID=A0ACB8QXM7_9AGAM|nr:hypothetical protein K488DRAFT_81909 [Vararia minispora EC-137]
MDRTHATPSHTQRQIVAIAAALQPLDGSFGDGYDYICPQREAQAAVSAALKAAACRLDFTESDLQHFLRALEDHSYTDVNFLASIVDAFVRAWRRQHAYTYKAEATEHFVEPYEKEEEKERLGGRDVDFEHELHANSRRCLSVWNEKMKTQNMTHGLNAYFKPVPPKAPPPKPNATAPILHQQPLLSITAATVEDVQRPSGPALWELAKAISDLPMNVPEAKEGDVLYALTIGSAYDIKDGDDPWEVLDRMLNRVFGFSKTAEEISVLVRRGGYSMQFVVETMCVFVERYRIDPWLLEGEVRRM